MLLCFAAAIATCAAAFFAAIFYESGDGVLPSYVRLENAYERVPSARMPKRQASNQALPAKGALTLPPVVTSDEALPGPRGATTTAPAADTAIDAVEVERLRARIRTGYLLTTSELTLLEAADAPAADEETGAAAKSDRPRLSSAPIVPSEGPRSADAKRRDLSRQTNSFGKGANGSSRSPASGGPRSDRRGKSGSTPSPSQKRDAAAWQA